MTQDATSAVPTNIAAYGEGFAQVLASMSCLTDAGHAACPKEWRDLTNLLHTLIEDEGMTTQMAAWEAAVPDQLVAEYRLSVGI